MTFRATVITAMLTAGLLLPSCVNTPQAAEEAFDPSAGVDANGRIPKAEKPGDLSHPERWRYIPEGRIKPGGVVDRFLYSTFFLPVVFYDEEVGLGGGVGVTDIDFRTQRRREQASMGFTYTTEGQERYAISWSRRLHHRDLAGGGVVQEERSSVRARMGYTRTLTRRFFGLGPDTTDDDEVSYTDEVSWGGVGMQLALPGAADNFILSTGLSGEYHNLASGQVEDVPTMQDNHPGLVSAGDGHGSAWVNLALAYDTRDSMVAPYRGWRVAVGASAAPWQDDGEQGAVFGAEANWVTPLPGLFHDGGDPQEEHPPTDSFALGAKVNWTEGDLPFYFLPTLGGSETLRGYVPHRWTARSTWHAGAEYRLWVIPRGFDVYGPVRIERVGVALFGEVGGVGDRPGELPDSPVLWSTGASLRVSLERQGLFRGDIGVSDEGINITGGYGVSF